jgi:hypothetical protein
MPGDIVTSYILNFVEEQLISQIKILATLTAPPPAITPPGEITPPTPNTRPYKLTQDQINSLTTALQTIQTSIQNQFKDQIKDQLLKQIASALKNLDIKILTNLLKVIQQNTQLLS